MSWLRALFYDRILIAYVLSLLMVLVALFTGEVWIGMVGVIVGVVTHYVERGDREQ